MSETTNLPNKVKNKNCTKIFNKNSAIVVQQYDERFPEEDKPWLNSDKLEKIEGLPDYGYRLRMDHEFKEPCKPFSVPHYHHIYKFMGFGLRYAKAWYKLKRKKKTFCIDNFDMVPWKPIYGAPIGGIGGGTIGRGWKGEFCRFQMQPGIYEHVTVDTDQFILTVRKNGHTVYHRVLSPFPSSTGGKSNNNNKHKRNRATDNALDSWVWDFPAKDATYQALYPLAWYVYRVPEVNLKLTCRQISPVIPHDYKDSSLPCAVFDWSIESLGSSSSSSNPLRSDDWSKDEPIEVALTFVFQAGIGRKPGTAAVGGAYSRTFCGDVSSGDIKGFKGVEMKDSVGDSDCSYLIAALDTGEEDGCQKEEVSGTNKFDPNGCGGKLWSQLYDDLSLERLKDGETSEPTRNGESLACAVSVKRNFSRRPSSSSSSSFFRSSSSSNNNGCGGSDNLGGDSGNLGGGSDNLGGGRGGGSGNLGGGSSNLGGGRGGGSGNLGGGRGPPSCSRSNSDWKSDRLLLADGLVGGGGGGEEVSGDGAGNKVAVTTTNSGDVVVADVASVADGLVGGEDVVVVVNGVDNKVAATTTNSGSVVVADVASVTDEEMGGEGRNWGEGGGEKGERGCRITFCLAWHMPVVRFGGKAKSYKRRYNRFWKTGREIVEYAFSNYEKWYEKITTWQKETLDLRLPSWYKSALFNELYYVSDGGTVWLEAEDEEDDDGGKEIIHDPLFSGDPETEKEKQLGQRLLEEYGRFAYLEGQEYRMYNTYDVHHYASFALIALWPQLQLSLQYDIANAVWKEQSDVVQFLVDGSRGPSKMKHCVPHDVGDPNEEPFLRLNAYAFHPTQDWKDLNLKFVLQVYRDFNHFHYHHVSSTAVRDDEDRRQRRRREEKNSRLNRNQNDRPPSPPPLPEGGGVADESGRDFNHYHASSVSSASVSAAVSDDKDRRRRRRREENNSRLNRSGDQQRSASAFTSVFPPSPSSPPLPEVGGVADESGRDQGRGYLEDMYPTVKAVMLKCLEWDKDGDGLIENSGFADQTYDAWTMIGPSAYCGGMWLAALKMFCLMADCLDQSEDRRKFTGVLQKAILSFDQRLWNGSYYNFDASRSDHHDCVMADQLAGFWFLCASNVYPYDVFPKENVQKTLQSLLEYNVMPFESGRMGAVNGGLGPRRGRPPGADLTSPQSDEFWTGVNYSLAAIMLNQNMPEECWRVAWGCNYTCFYRYGLAFQTPEAYFQDRRFRSLAYMRPLAIWAIQLEVEKRRRAGLESMP